MSDDKRKVGVGDRVEVLIPTNDREKGQGTVRRVRKHLAHVEMDNGAWIGTWTFHLNNLSTTRKG